MSGRKLGKRAKIAIGVVVGLLLMGGCLAAIGRGGESRKVMDKDEVYYEIGRTDVYETAGSQRANGRPCSWTRTKTPTIHISDMIEMGNVAVGQHGRVTVHPGEYFISYGCLPWYRVGD